MCPAHAASRLLSLAHKRIGVAGIAALARAPLLADSRGKPYTNATFLYWLRKDLAALNVRTVGERGQQLWGLHAFRRGGAQALAAAGWSDTTIMAWARWESSVIATYVADAPLIASVSFASTLVGGTGVVRELRTRSCDAPEISQVAAPAAFNAVTDWRESRDGARQGADDAGGASSASTPTKRARFGDWVDSPTNVPFIRTPSCGCGSGSGYPARLVEISPLRDQLLSAGHDQICGRALSAAGGDSMPTQPGCSSSNDESGVGPSPFVFLPGSAAAEVV